MSVSLHCINFLQNKMLDLLAKMSIRNALYNLYNNSKMTDDLTDLNFQQSLNSKNTKFNMIVSTRGQFYKSTSFWCLEHQNRCSKHQNANYYTFEMLICFKALCQLT